jgi:sialate O-acetylesterase
MIHVNRFVTTLGVALSLSNFAVPSSHAQDIPGPRIESEVSVPHVFGDNMVLQQGTNTAVWGWADDGAIVSVLIGNDVASARAENGKWIVHLHNLKAGGPYTLTITSKNILVFTNVLVGEVWLAGGQSNMEFPLKDSFMGASDIASANNPNIRLLKVPHVRLDEPTNDIGAHWMEASSATVGNFSAVAYYFARDLQAQLGVPVAIIESDWGGTPAEAWMDFKSLHNNPHWDSEVVKQWLIDQAHYNKRLAAFDAQKLRAQQNNTEFTNRPPGRPWRPAELYNGMIAPLVPFTIKGAIWYQGESNAGSPERADQYHTLFPGLIRDWRYLWGQGDFTFLLVQLAPYMDIKKEPGESAWASVREAQLESTKILPNVGMAVITDVGMEHNIHPVKKEPVGHRLALAAEAISYDEPVEYSGPNLVEAKAEGFHVALTFDHVSGGLVAKDGDLTGFAIAGPDQKFHWAVARIVGFDKVFVSSPEVDHPVAVRFGWANYPVVNLWNKQGLPASPFRTDNFEK